MVTFERRSVRTSNIGIWTDAMAFNLVSNSTVEVCDVHSTVERDSDRRVRRDQDRCLPVYRLESLNLLNWHLRLKYSLD